MVEAVLTCDSEAKELVIAEYAADGFVVIDDELVVRAD